MCRSIEDQAESETKRPTSVTSQSFQLSSEGAHLHDGWPDASGANTREPALPPILRMGSDQGIDLTIMDPQASSGHMQRELLESLYANEYSFPEHSSIVSNQVASASAGMATANSSQTPLLGNPDRALAPFLGLASENDVTSEPYEDRHTSPSFASSIFDSAPVDNQLSNIIEQPVFPALPPHSAHVQEELNNGNLQPKSNKLQDQFRGGSMYECNGNPVPLRHGDLTYQGAAGHSSQPEIAAGVAPFLGDVNGSETHSGSLVIPSFVSTIEVPSMSASPQVTAGTISTAALKQPRGKVAGSRKRNQEGNDQMRRQARCLGPKFTLEERRERNRLSSRRSRKRLKKELCEMEEEVNNDREVRDRWKTLVLKCHAALQKAMQNVKDDNVLANQITESLRDVEETIRNCSMTFDVASVNSIDINYTKPDDGADKEE